MRAPRFGGGGGGGAPEEDVADAALNALSEELTGRGPRRLAGGETVTCVGSAEIPVVCRWCCNTSNRSRIWRTSAVNVWIAVAIPDIPADIARIRRSRLSVWFDVLAHALSPFWRGGGCCCCSTGNASNAKPEGGGPDMAWSASVAASEDPGSGTLPEPKAVEGQHDGGGAWSSLSNRE